MVVISLNKCFTVFPFLIGRLASCEINTIWTFHPPEFSRKILL